MFINNKKEASNKFPQACLSNQYFTFHVNGDRWNLRNLRTETEPRVLSGESDHVLWNNEGNFELPNKTEKEDQTKTFHGAYSRNLPEYSRIPWCFVPSVKSPSRGNLVYLHAYAILGRKSSFPLEAHDPIDQSWKFLRKQPRKNSEACLRFAFKKSLRSSTEKISYSSNQSVNCTVTLVRAELLAVAAGKLFGR